MITISFQTNDKQKHEIRVWKTSSPYIAVHKTPDIRGPWVATHIPSGYRIKGYLASKKDALHFVDEIKDSMDWSKGAEDIKREFEGKGIKSLA